MQLTAHCDCGASLPVKQSQAGTTIPCSACGASVDVPTLSALRALLGEAYVPLSAIERIQALVKRGELPRSGECPYSGRPVNCTLYFDVECESQWVKRREMGDLPDSARLVLHLLVGWLGEALTRWGTRPAEIVGNDIEIEIPLGVNTEAAASISRIKSQRRLRKLLSQVPEYRQLFGEYPQAKVRSVRAIEE